MSPSPTADAINDRVRLPYEFDVAKMSEEIRLLQLHDYVYYDVMPLRSPAYIVDPSIPKPPPADDYADGSWTDWLDTSALKQSPYLTSVVDAFREHTTVNLVRLLRLAPHSDVREHTDPTLGLHIHQSMIRFTIPILRNDQVTFFLNGTPVPMKPGECWYLRLTDPHKIINHGPTERINLTIDVIPNEWARSLVEKSQAGIS